MPDRQPFPPDFLDSVRAIVGDRGLLTEPSSVAPYLEDWRRLYKGRSQAVIRPSTTEELAAVVRPVADADCPAGRQHLHGWRGGAE